MGPTADGSVTPQPKVLDLCSCLAWSCPHPGPTLPIRVKGWFPIVASLVAVCSADCACTLGCHGDVGSCAELPGCDQHCACADPAADRRNWRCARTPVCTTTEATTTAYDCKSGRSESREFSEPGPPKPASPENQLFCVAQLC